MSELIAKVEEIVAKIAPEAQALIDILKKFYDEVLAKYVK